MELDLNETQRLIRDSARKFARERIAPRARQLDKDGQFPVDLIRELGSQGFMGINLPMALGGAEAGVVSYALAMMEISAACASTAVAMGVTNMCAELIYRFGTEAQRLRFVPKLTSGEALVGAFALSEPHCGSDA